MALVGRLAGATCHGRICVCVGTVNQECTHHQSFAHLSNRSICPIGSELSYSSRLQRPGRFRSASSGYLSSSKASGVEGPSCPSIYLTNVLHSPDPQPSTPTPLLPRGTQPGSTLKPPSQAAPPPPSSQTHPTPHADSACPAPRPSGTQCSRPA